MDGAEISQTYQYMRGIDGGRGSRVDAAEARKSRWLLDRGQESVCVLRWTDLTTCDVSTSPGALLCKIHARKINHLVDNGPAVRVRCGEWRRHLCVKYKIKVKMAFFNRRWPENSHE